MSEPVATLPLRPDPDPVAQPAPDQGVVHHHQSLGQRRADVVLVFGGRGAGAALGAVDDDEVRGRALLHHRLADRQQLVAGADAELEPVGLPPASSRM